MSRVTPAEVREIVQTSLSDATIQIWIDGAHAIVNANAECIGGDEELLTQVELFLSAHFVAMLTPSSGRYVEKEKLDVFETTYTTPAGLKNIIDNSPYGTTANMLANGCLTSTTRAVCKLFVVG